MAAPPQRAASRRQRPWLWAALVAILVLYLLGAVRLNPIARFGSFQDDGVYFSAAKALADGQGYILPSFPDRLPSMKYPELYPLLLAGVWKLDPHFPGNVVIAVGITLGFGCLALLFTFLMLRRWPGIGDWPALLIVLLVGLSPYFLYLSPMVLSDIPFMALMLGAAWLAELALDSAGGRPDRKRGSDRGHRAPKSGDANDAAPNAGGSATRPYRDAWLAAGAGVLAGMSVGFRSLGIPVAAGIGLLLLFRREPNDAAARHRRFHLHRRQIKKLFWFCLTGLPLTLYWSWPAVSGILGLTPPAVVGDPTGSGWTQTVCFYSSYACEWRANVPNLETLTSMMTLNLGLAAQAPGLDLLQPMATASGILELLAVILVSAGAYLGAVRICRRDGCHPLHAIFPLYLLAVAMWPFWPYRYLVAFAPLFLAGLWVEGKHIYQGCALRLKRGRGRQERAEAWILTLGALALAGTIALNYAYALPQAEGQIAAESEEASHDEAGAYQWIHQHSSPNARVVASSDGLTYLYTGRRSAWGIALLVGTYLRGIRYSEREAAHLGDVARHIRASYWLTAPDDYSTGTNAGRRLLVAAQTKLLATAPVVYRSPDGWITLYDTRCIFGALPASDCAGGAPRLPRAEQQFSHTVPARPHGRERSRRTAPGSKQRSSG